MVMLNVPALQITTVVVAETVTPGVTNVTVPPTNIVITVLKDSSYNHLKEIELSVIQIVQSTTSKTGLPDNVNNVLTHVIVVPDQKLTNVPVVKLHTP